MAAVAGPGCTRSASAPAVLRPARGRSEVIDDRQEVEADTGLLVAHRRPPSTACAGRSSAPHHGLGRDRTIGQSLPSGPRGAPLPGGPAGDRHVLQIVFCTYSGIFW